jgi:hypothetical protein
MNPSSPGATDDLRAAFLELSASLQCLHGALTEFQHGLIEAQIGGGDPAAAQAMAAARSLIDRALGSAR